MIGETFVYYWFVCVYQPNNIRYKMQIELIKHITVHCHAHTHAFWTTEANEQRKKCIHSTGAHYSFRVSPSSVLALSDRSNPINRRSTIQHVFIPQRSIVIPSCLSHCLYKMPEQIRMASERSSITAFAYVQRSVFFKRKNV